MDFKTFVRIPMTNKNNTHYRNAFRKSTCAYLMYLQITTNNLHLFFRLISKLNLGKTRTVLAT